MIIEEFEPDVFRQLIEYIHTGCLTLQPRTLLGVMNAADYYGLDELKHACSGFIQVRGDLLMNDLISFKILFLTLRVLYDLFLFLNHWTYVIF